jgi:DNA-binding beta-propeller fold protein YncE
MPRRFVYLLLISPLLFSCSRSIYSGLASPELVLYPVPPDTTRIQFLARISGSGDMSGGRKSIARFITGEQEQSMIINKPYGVAIQKGKIMVCDTYIHGLEIIDLDRGKFEQFVPRGRGELKVPINCFIDEKGFLYIADSERKQVVVFDEKRNFYDCFGETEDFKPVDVFVRDNQVWVADVAGHQVHVYSADSARTLLKSFPEVNSKDPESLFSPTNIFVTSDKVYVSDFGDFRVKVYDHDGAFIGGIGSYGTSVGQFTRPKGIAVDRESNLLVVDAGFENVQMFNADGKLLMHIGGNYKGPGDMWLPAKVVIDYENTRYFERLVDPAFKLRYLILVTNQFGPDKLNIYGAVEPSGRDIKPGEPSPKK